MRDTLIGMRFTAQDYVDKLDEGILEFGRYTLHDKGLTEIMFTEEFKGDLKTATGPEVGQLLVEILDYDSAKIASEDDRQALVNYFAGDEDYRDEADFNALLGVDSRLTY
jgi:hypothetical protein